MSEPDDLEYASRIAREVVLALEAHGMKAAIGGAIAYGFWGTTRGTKDADINVFVGEARYPELQRVLEEAGLGPAAGRRDGAEEGDLRRRRVVGSRAGRRRSREEQTAEALAETHRSQRGRGDPARQAGGQDLGGSSPFAAKW